MKKRKTLLDDHRSNSGYIGRIGKDHDEYGSVLKENVDPQLHTFFNAFTPSPGRKIVRRVNDTTATTPNGQTIMKLQTKIGPFVHFSTALVETPVKTKPDQASTSKYAEEISESLSQSEEKTMLACFNLDDIEKVREQKKQQKNRRKKSQGRVMSSSSRTASATKIARKYKITNSYKQRFEWTHLIAYRFLGEEGQIPTNLVLATKECNSLMMIFEDAIVDLCDRLPFEDSTVSLFVSADTIPGTHIGTCIHYRIVAEDLDFDLKVKFDPQMTAKPSRNLEGDIHRLLKYALKAKHPVCFDTPTPQKPKKSNDHDCVDEEIGTPIKAMTLSF